MSMAGYKHTDEAKEKIRAYRHTDEAKKKISLASMGNKYACGIKPSAETRAKRSASMARYYESSEARTKTGEATKRAMASPEARAKLSATGKRYYEEETLSARARRIESCRKAMASPEARAKRSASTILALSTPEARANMCASAQRMLASPEGSKLRAKRKVISKRLFQDPSYRAKLARGWDLKPNKAELVLFGLLESIYPGEWKYTGDFSFIINGKNPDFVCCNGQKKVIELFGDYWHRGEDPKERAKVFKPFGYKTLVIWGRELKDVKKVTQRIRKFAVQKPHAEGDLE